MHEGGWPPTGKYILLSDSVKPEGICDAEQQFSAVFFLQ